MESLRDEVLALEKHVYTLDTQNKELFAELEKFAMTDEMIKSTLDRKNKVNELKEHLYTDLQKSQHNLRMKSPQRKWERA
jgi:hypothetical protein